MHLPARYISSFFTKPNAADPDQEWGIHQFTPVDSKNYFKAVGVLPRPMKQFGLEVELIGNWENSKYGRQFKFTNCLVNHPSGYEGTLSFLQQARGIGSITARKIWDAYGEESIQKCIQDPIQMHKDTGLSLELCQAASVLYSQTEFESRYQRPLTTLFAGIRIPKETAKWALKHLRGDPVKIIKANPFVLIDAPRVNFAICEALRLKLKLPPDMLERYQAAMIYIFQQNDGDTWLGKRFCIDELCKLVQIQAKAAVDVITQLLEQDYVRAYEGFIGLTTEVKLEYELCQRIQERCGPFPWPEIDADTLTPHQLAEVQQAQSNGSFAVLLGSAGTGKTFSAAAVVKSFGPSANIVACAPTGKAAQRLTESFCDIGTHLRARTIHSTLKAYPTDRGWRFEKNEEDPLDADLVIVDEIGMATNYLANALFKAITPITPVLCLGDPNQLPPIGRGTLLRDWQSPQFKKGFLTHVHRNTGQLQHLCARLSTGEKVPFDVLPRTQRTWATEHNIYLEPATSNQQAKANLIRFLQKIRNDEFVWPNGHAVDVVKEVQIVVPMNDNGPVSRVSLNEDLQKLLNSTKSEHVYYRPYDKVICLQNGMYPRADGSGSVYVANGELGYVVDAKQKFVHIRMVLTDVVITYPTAKQGQNFDLAYAITCHKMQGDQSPIVVIVLNHGYSILNREWLYTACTRAKEFCLVIGSQKQLNQAIDIVDIWKRKSFMLDWFSGKEPQQWKR